MGAVGFPKQKFGGHSPDLHVLVPKISLAQHRNWQNIQSCDLFTNRFTSITFGEIICCKTFDAVRIALPEVREVTNIQTMCEAFNKTPVTKILLGKVKQALTDVFDVTSSIRDFRAHIFCLQTTQELPKKHHEAGPPEQLPTNALSQIDYGHNRLCKDCKEVCLCQRTTQRAFWYI